MNYIDQAEKDLKDGWLTYEGVIGLINNFSCYTRTYTYDAPTDEMKEQFIWCEQHLGEHKKRWLFIPQVIEKDYNYWFFSKQKEMTLFQLAWKTL